MHRSTAMATIVLVWCTAACSLLPGQGHPSASAPQGGSQPTVSPTSSPQNGPTATSPSPDPGASADPSATTPTLAGAYRHDESGVLRFEVATCDGEQVGSGFKISDSLAVTVAHVVADASVVRVIDGSTSTAGEVIGVDESADVALVSLVKPLSGTDLTFADTSPSVGESVAAIGFPEGDPLTYLPGTINGLNRKAVIAGTPRHSMIELDAATTHGNSGGPVIDAAGKVLGLVDSGPDGEPGRRLAVSASVADPLIEGWEGNPNPVAEQTCATIAGPNGTTVQPDNPSDALDEAVATLEVYFGSIDNGDFPTAVAQLYEPTSTAKFQRAVTSSQDTVTYAEQLPSSGDGAPNIWVQFTSTQDAGSGPKARPLETCTKWSLDYHFARRNGLWLITRTSPHDGSGNSSC